MFAKTRLYGTCRDIGRGFESKNEDDMTVILF